MIDTPRTYAARWVFPGIGPPLERGTLAVLGSRIVAVEPFGVHKPDVDFGDSLLLPGFVNAHAHLDLSAAKGLIPPTSPEAFPEWLKGVIAYRRMRTPQQIEADIHTGLAECLQAGTTLVGDISSGGASWSELAKAPMGSVVFRELLGLGAERAIQARMEFEAWFSVAIGASGRKQDPSPALTPFACPLPAAGRGGQTDCRPGVSPHSPYSCRAELFDVRGIAAVHLAESPGELELLERRTGPFVDFLKGLNVWDESGLVHSPAEILRRIRSAERALIVHGNYLDPELASEFTSNMTLVVCPRTHAAFGHPPHPFREFARRGIRVCLGTDSLASNPDLDILAEARFLHRQYPDLPGDWLLNSITRNGAEALGFDHVCGRLEPGFSADFVVIPLKHFPDTDPYSALWNGTENPRDRRTFYRGIERTHPLD